MNEKSVLVSEAVRAGDVYLVHFDCPDCGASELAGYPLTTCPACNAKLDSYPVDFEDASWRLLAGSKRRAGQRIAKKTIQFLYRLQSGQCAYCDQALEAYDVEHIVPLAVGGTNNAANLCLSCPRCNRLAGAKYFPSIMAKKDYVLERIRQRGR